MPLIKYTPRSIVIIIDHFNEFFQPSRDESNQVPLETLRRDVKALARAVRKGGAIQNYAFSEIFCRKNFYYMRAIFEMYPQVREIFPQ